MNRPHPASIVLLGLAVLLAASFRDGMDLFLGCLALLLLALFAAAFHLRSLLRRSAWLLLTMLVMFGWMTPGTPLPNVPGASQEGLMLAAINIARLLVALSAVALMLKALPPPELVAGMRSLLGPLALMNISRDRIAVRLALTLTEVESSRNGESRVAGQVAGTLILPASGFGATDIVLGTMASALVFAAWLG